MACEEIYSRKIKTIQSILNNAVYFILKVKLRGSWKKASEGFVREYSNGAGNRGICDRDLLGGTLCGEGAGIAGNGRSVNYHAVWENYYIGRGSGLDAAWDREPCYIECLLPDEWTSRFFWRIYCSQVRKRCRMLSIEELKNILITKSALN